MTHDRRFTAQKIGKRIALIQRMVHRSALPMDPFRLMELPDARTQPPLGADAGSWSQIYWESHWGGQDIHYFLVSSITVPKGWGGPGPVALYLPMGEAGDIFTHPEGLLYIDGQPFASADRYHHTIYLPDGIADGRPHRVELHGWTGLTGWPPDPTDRRQLFMRTCRVVQIDIPTRDFLSKAEVALDVATHLDPQRPEKYRLLNALDAAFLQLDTRDPLGDAFYRSVPRAMEVLEAGVTRAGAPMDVTLHGIGHAHMDIAYLWPIDQIRRKNARTYSNVLRLMERHPEYTFSHSQPQLYAYTERDYPEIFAQIQARVAESRWEPMGGMWVEPDTNIPGAEALVRQITLGRRYFRERFGAPAETPVLWLPDTFGMSWCLPQLMRQAGLKWLVTNKVNWNQYNKMTASTTWWQGIDGSRVMTHFLTTPREVQHLPFPTNYKSDLSASEVIGTWEESTVKEYIADLPICYGYGDGGGGPTGELIRRAQVYAEMPGAPKLKMSRIRDFFAAIEDKGTNLATWADELYLEGHRGVLTSQGWIKRANRRAEAALHEVEFLCAMAQAGQQPVPHHRLRRAWELLCVNQFHDILTGTSVTEVFEDAKRDYAEIANILSEIRRGLRTDSPAQVLANAMPMAATRQALLPPGIDLPNGTISQEVRGGALVQLHAPPYALIPITGAPPTGSVRAEESEAGIVLKNDLLEVEIAPDGRLTRIYDCEANRNVLKPGETGNQLQVFEDRPISWDAWDIDAFFEDRGEIIGGLTRLEVAENGPLRTAVRIERDYRSSHIWQDIRLRDGSKRIDFVTRVDWRETHLLLKVAFPVEVFSPVATYEIQWGSIMRPTHRNTSWDYAKFEVPAHKWADLSEAGYGVALLNDCKYGYDVKDDVMRLSLIKSATMPDPVGDQGEHIFTYALLPHRGDWRADVLREAYDLNLPLAVARHRSQAPPLVETDSPNVVIETVKPADDGNGIIVRLFEAYRSRGRIRLRFAQTPTRVERCTLLEEAIDTLQLDAKMVSLDLGPFEIVSLRVTFD